MPAQPAWLEILEKADVPPAQARAVVQAIEIEIAGAKETLATKPDILILRHEMAEMRTELRHSLEMKFAALEPKISSMVTHRQLYGALAAQMTLLFGIAYFFVAHLPR